MRTLDISYTVDDTARTGTIEYPDYWCFVFNPLYVTITLDDTSVNSEIAIQLSGGSTSHVLYANFFSGKAKVYVSRMMQILFEDVDNYRSVSVTLSITEDDVALYTGDLTFMAVWAGLRIGDQFGRYGAFEFNGEDLSHVRNVVWFKNFPFYVSMFRSDSDETVYAKYDDNDYDEDLQIFRYPITGIVEGDLPDFEDTTFNASASDDDSTISASVVAEVYLNVTNGQFYLSVSGTCYSSWAAVGDYGAVADYNDTSTATARTDTEWAYGGLIVRWNSERMELEYATAGNAEDMGIFDLNPAITFPDATKSAQYLINIQTVSSSIFDAEFNIVFEDTSLICNEVVNMSISDAQDGIYLRWIDRYGLLQYYLFVEGESTVKVTGSDDMKNIDRSYYGMAFGKLQRYIELTDMETVKCCAVSLPKEILSYVKTIANSPIVERYLGATREGTEIWCPVKVAEGSYTTDADTELTDYEISIEYMEEVTQRL